MAATLRIKIDTVGSLKDSSPKRQEKVALHSHQRLHICSNIRLNSLILLRSKRCHCSDRCVWKPMVQTIKTSIRLTRKQLTWEPERAELKLNTSCQPFINPMADSPTPTPSLTSTEQCCSQQLRQNWCWQARDNRFSFRTNCIHTAQWWGGWVVGTWGEAEWYEPWEAILTPQQVSEFNCNVCTLRVPVLSRKHIIRKAFWRRW